MPLNYPFSVPSGTNIIPEYSGSSTLGTNSLPFDVVYADQLIVNGTVVNISGAEFLGGALTSNLTPTVAGTLAVGTQELPFSSGTFNTLNASVVSGTSISGNQIYRNGSELNLIYASISGENFTGLITAPVISGTTISGGSIYQGGMRVVDSGIGAGSVTVTRKDGTLTISGATYTLPSNVVQSASNSGNGFAVYNSQSGSNLVFNSISGAGNVTVSSTAGLLTVSGTLYALPSAVTFTTVNSSVVSGTTISGNAFYLNGVALTNYVLPTTINATVLSGTTISGNILVVPTATHTLVNSSVVSGTTISGNAFYLNGVALTNYVLPTTINAIVLSGTTISGNTLVVPTATHTLVNSSVVSGTTISGNSLYLNGVQFVPANYQPVGNYVVSGSSTILATLNATVLSGTTISGNSAAISTVTSTTVNSATVSGTTINNDTLSSKIGTFTTVVNSPVVSGTVVSGGSVYQNGIQDLTTVSSSGVGVSLFGTKVSSTAFLNSISGLGTITISGPTAGVITISGATTGLPPTVVQTASNSGTGFAVYNSQNGSNLVFNTISGNGNITVSSTNGTINVSGTQYVLPSSLTGLTLVSSAVISGTTISGNSLYLNGAQFIPANYQPVGNYVVSGSSTILNILNTAVISGTTISGGSISNNGVQVLTAVSTSGTGVSLFNTKTSSTAFLNSISGLGTVTVGTASNGVINISGAAYTLPLNIVSGVSSSGTGQAIYNSQVGQQVYLNSISGLGNVTTTYSNGVISISGSSTPLPSTATFTSLYSNLISGTTISGNAVFASGVQIVPGNYQPTGNYVVSGSSTILNTLNASTLSGTTGNISTANITTLRTSYIAGGGVLIDATAVGGSFTASGTAVTLNAAGPLNLVSTNVFNVTSTTLNSDGAGFRFTTPISGTTISGNAVFDNGNRVLANVSTSGAGVSLINSGTGPTAFLNSISGAGSVTISSVGGLITVSGLSAGTGDVVGPASSTGDAIVVFSGTTGKLVKNSSVIISNNGTTLSAPVISGTTFSGGTYIGDTTMLNFVIDGGGSVISSGSAGFLEIPYSATPLSWDLLGNISGSLSVDVYRNTYANWSGAASATSSLSIVGSEKPTIASAFKGQDTSLTTWSGINAGDILSFHVDVTPTLVTRATLSLKLRKTS